MGRADRRAGSVAILALVGMLAMVSGVGGHRWARAHVDYYTGTTGFSVGCTSCHFDARGGTIRDRILKPRYLSPLKIAVSPDGLRLYATAQEAGMLLVIDAPNRRPIDAIPAGRRPHSLVLDRDGRIAYVTDHDNDAVSVIDLRERRVEATLPAGYGPAGIALTGDGRLLVANALGGDVSVIDVASRTETARLTAGNYPYAVAATSEGGIALVTGLLARPTRASGTPAAELTRIDTLRTRVAARISLDGAHLLEGAAIAPGGDLALLTLVRPKNLLPALQVERGWMMTNGMAVVDLATGDLTQLPLDDVDAFYADPSDVVITPDGRTAFVSHGGCDTVSAIDLARLRRLLEETDAGRRAGLADRLSVSQRYVVARIPTGSNPRGLALSPDGRLLYVAERLDDSIGIIDVAGLRRIGGIDLGGPRHETVLRRGEKVFNSAAATLQHQFSCRSCHPDNHVDGLQYDFEPDGLGRNIVDNRTLLGIGGTGPFKWSGRNTSLYMQCGIRFARFLTRSEPFAQPDLNALTAFIASLPPPRPRPLAPAGDLMEARRRGKAIFERAAMRDGTPIPGTNRCLTCHPPPHYTDRQRRDIGSASPGDSDTAFDTPQLRAVGLTAPYLHDGKVMTLEGIWTVYSPGDEHGVTSDLGKQGLNDLVEYLRSL